MHHARLPENIIVDLLCQLEFERIDRFSKAVEVGYIPTEGDSIVAHTTTYKTKRQ
jgi:hypothetical protein